VATLRVCIGIAGDKSADGTAFADALHKVALTDTPRGPFSIDRYGNAVGSIFVRKYEKKGDQLVNTVIKTYPNVSQFWTYPEEEFLKNPVNSRDWPLAKNLE
jgi:branched-chain amino acid transport system substrate-binding protein